MPVPAIVATDVFDAAQRRLATNQQQARRNTIYKYLLRGLVSCGHCKLSCTGRVGHPSATYQYYVCRGKLPTVVSNREQHCPSRLIPTQQLDAVVWDDLCRVVRHPEVVAHELQRAQAGDWVPQELRRRQASLRAVRVGLSRSKRVCWRRIWPESSTWPRSSSKELSCNGVRKRCLHASEKSLLRVSASSPSKTLPVRQPRFSTSYPADSSKLPSNSGVNW